MENAPKCTERGALVPVPCAEYYMDVVSREFPHSGLMLLFQSLACRECPIGNESNNQERGNSRKPEFHFLTSLTVLMKV